MKKLLSIDEIREQVDHKQQQQQQRKQPEKTFRGVLGFQPKLSLGVIIGSMMSLDLAFIMWIMSWIQMKWIWIWVKKRGDEWEMSKIVDWCPICGKPIFIYENQAFKRQFIERIEKDQSSKILADDDKRYVFDSYQWLIIFRKQKSVYGSCNNTFFSFFYCN